MNNFHLSRGDLPEIAHSPVSRRPDLPADHGANQTKRPGAEHRAKSGCRVFVLRTGCVTGRSRSRDKKPPPARKVPTLPNPTPPQGECAKKKKARRAWHTPGQYKGGTYRLRQDELRILGATPPSRRSPQPGRRGRFLLARNPLPCFAVAGWEGKRDGQADPGRAYVWFWRVSGRRRDRDRRHGVGPLNQRTNRSRWASACCRAREG